MRKATPEEQRAWEIAVKNKNYEEAKYLASKIMGTYEEPKDRVIRNVNNTGGNVDLHGNPIVFIKRDADTIANQTYNVPTVQSKVQVPKIAPVLQTNAPVWQVPKNYAQTPDYSPLQYANYTPPQTINAPTTSIPKMVNVPNISMPDIDTNNLVKVGIVGFMAILLLKAIK